MSADMAKGCLSENVIIFKPRKYTFSLPHDPSNEELAFDWTLSEDDKVQILKHRGNDNCRRYAVQLCVLRKYGRFLDNYSSLPTKVISYLSHQIEIEPTMSLSTPSRETTETDYQKEIIEYLGYSQFNDEINDAIEDWILNITQKSLFIENLFQKAEEFLKENKVVLPPVKYMERIVSSAYTKAEQNIFNSITRQIPLDVRESIDKVLQTSVHANKSDFFLFSEYPPEAKAKKVAECLNKYNELLAIGIDKLKFSNIAPELLRELNKVVKTYDAWRIKRFNDDKRYAVAACYLFESKKTILDNLVYMNAQFLTTVERQARNDYEKEHKALRKRLKKGLATLENLAKAVLSFENSKPLSLIELYKKIDQKDVSNAIKSCEEFRNLEENGYVEKLHRKYRNFRRYFPLFLNLNFQSETGAEPLLHAINILRRLDSGELKTLPPDVPIEFVPASWKKALTTKDSTIIRKTWEIALALKIRDSLKSGDLFLPDSRRHVSFWNLVYDDKKWVSEKKTAYKKLKLPHSFKSILSTLTAEYNVLIKNAINSLNDNRFIKIENESIRYRKEKALIVSPETKKLQHYIEMNMPRIRIEQLLKEVDSLCNFSDELTPIDGIPIGKNERLPTLYASLVAHGTNIGVSTMANSTDRITVDMLQGISKSSLRENTLKSANVSLVNYHRKLEVSSKLGDGHISSSDAQRFGVNRSSLLSSFYPRYFGFYDRAVSIYTHVSDQYDVFSSLVISCAAREALYVLNGILENDSDLDIRQHHTDTHGYTDHIFALCYLLGFSFMPRLKKLHKQRFFKIDKNAHYGHLEPLFKGTINLDVIIEQWDQLIRVAASLRNRIVPAHVIVQRLSSSSRSDRLSKAFTELGRLIKTLYLLRYIQDPDLRRQVHKQLNRGEHRHILAKHIFFANRGEFRTGDLTQIMNKASCLSLLSNAILVWNSIHIDKIVKEINKKGEYKIDENDLAGISPLLHEHIIVNGTYDFFSYRKEKVPDIRGIV